MKKRQKRSETFMGFTAPPITCDHRLHSLFSPPLFWPWKLSWKTWQRSELSVLSAVRWIKPPASNIKHSLERHLRHLRRRGPNWWSQLLSVTYSKTGAVQSRSAQWEVRSPSTPFIHGLIQLEGNYRPPEASRSSSVSVPIREPCCVGSPLDCTGWCLHRRAACQTAERAAANTREGVVCHKLEIWGITRGRQQSVFYMMNMDE